MDDEILDRPSMRRGRARPVRAEYDLSVNGQTIGMIAAGVGLTFSVAYLVLGAMGVRSLREIRARLSRKS